MKLGEIITARGFCERGDEFELLAEPKIPRDRSSRERCLCRRVAMAKHGWSIARPRHRPVRSCFVQLNGELKWAARTSSVIERNSASRRTPSSLYDEVSKTVRSPRRKTRSDLRKGDIFFEIAATDPQKLSRAIEAYDQLHRIRTRRRYWRNQPL